MAQTLDVIFLEASAKKLEQLVTRIRDCAGKLSTDEIWARGHENENAIGNLVLHLNGNVRQWILSGVGGEPDARVRDLEFSARGGIEPGALGGLLREAVDGAVAVLRSLPHARLADRRTVQGHDVTVLKAILHVVEHFSGHTAQIIFITKMLTGEDLGFYSYLSKPQPHAGKIA